LSLCLGICDFETTDNDRRIKRIKTDFRLISIEKVLRRFSNEQYDVHYAHGDGIEQTSIPFPATNVL
jgi:hypothetical protein